MEQDHKPIDKEYLVSSLKGFDSDVLSNKYLNSDDEQLHTHDNKEVLDKLNVSESGTLLFDGDEINQNELSALLEQNEVLTSHIVEEADRAYIRENAIENQLSTEAQTIRQLIDLSYANANGYTDNKIASLINGAPSTLDTLKEIADALDANDDVVEALNDAVGSKANQAEVDSHINNQTIHMTATEKENLSTPAFTQAPGRTNIESNESLSILFGKIKKWFADLDAVAFSGDYNDLTNKPAIPTKTSQLINDDTTIMTQTLAAGSTTLTFTSDAITDESMIDVYTDSYGVNPNNITQSGNTLTLTFDAQAKNVNVKVKVK